VHHHGHLVGGPGEGRHFEHGKARLRTVKRDALHNADSFSRGASTTGLGCMRWVERRLPGTNLREK
jgi:hypothetical protein